MKQASVYANNKILYPRMLNGIAILLGINECRIRMRISMKQIFSHDWKHMSHNPPCVGLSVEVTCRHHYNLQCMSERINCKNSGQRCWEEEEGTDIMYSYFCAHAP